MHHNGLCVLMDWPFPKCLRPVAADPCTATPCHKSRNELKCLCDGGAEAGLEHQAASETTTVAFVQLVVTCVQI